MPRSKAAPRVQGPYSERGGLRFRVRICDEAGHRDLYYPTLKEAQDGMMQAARALPKLSKKRQLGNVLDEYIEEKMQRGLCGTTTANEQGARLLGWLADPLEEDIARLTPKRAAAHYERVVAMPTRKTGRPPTAATQRLYLRLAQALFRWAVRKGYVRENPFATIQPVGRPSRGKKQLRFEEAERFIAVGFCMFDEKSVLRLGLCLCRGLEAAHRQGVLHRDIKPVEVAVAWLVGK